MIRPTEPRETPAILEIARATGVFKALELVALGEVLDDYHAREFGNGHRCVSYEIEGEVVGFAYFAPAAMADRVWYLYWIAVDPTRQGQGIGVSLLNHVEDAIREARGRLHLIETSSLPHYEPTRTFYLKRGYVIASILRDFYADGDDLVVFAKRFLPRASVSP
jgi:ribosomal protein S18 acetylase RimI-like enzyme